MVENKEHYFYVLHCKDNTFYAGYTIDLDRRLEEHNSGTGAKYTKLAKRRPAKMIHHEVFTTRSEAMKAEYAFKQLTRKQKENYLLQFKTPKKTTLVVHP
ncbi:GIY-YIG nuclease family protein [Vagococcus fluvialis]|uniref:GIY-YIG nuclease family protein n=1 Tax=Vagococcus fluvialis TaxID=2738 RepID=UPI003B5BBAD0